MSCVVTAGVGMAAGVSLMAALQGAGVSEPWTALMALATLGLALVSYQQIQESLRPFLVWDGYWQCVDAEERTILVKNIGRTEARMFAVEHIVDGAPRRSVGDWPLGPHSTRDVQLEVRGRYTGMFVVRYKGPSGRRYELRDCLEGIFLGAGALPRGCYPTTPAEKVGL